MTRKTDAELIAELRTEMQEGFRVRDEKFEALRAVVEEATLGAYAGSAPPGAVYNKLPDGSTMVSDGKGGMVWQFPNAPVGANPDGSPINVVKNEMQPAPSDWFLGTQVRRKGVPSDEQYNYRLMSFSDDRASIRAESASAPIESRILEYPWTQFELVK